jgi:hypothetical protein
MMVWAVVVFFPSALSVFSALEVVKKLSSILRIPNARII